VRFTEKLTGAEKVATQVLHVVMTYDCKKMHAMRKRIHIIISCISENIGWAEYIVCPPNVIIGWAAAHPAP